MKVVDGLSEYNPPDQGVVLTIGNFDGVHLGHQEIFSTALRLAGDLDGAPVVAITFEPHPRVILTPDNVPARLTTRDEKLTMLELCGVDTVVVARSEPALLARPALRFLQDIVSRFRPRAIVEGASFSFGKSRLGNVEMLRDHAGRLGYDLRIVETLVCEDLPAKPSISSSNVREELRNGNVQAAHALLGRPYTFCGVVGSGAGRGKLLGFATANIENIPNLLPAHAVYAAAAELDTGAVHLAAVNIGPQPTFQSDVPRVEAHLLDFDGNLNGASVRLHLFRRIRPQRRFESAGDLAAQLRRDTEAVRACGVEAGPDVGIPRNLRTRSQ